MNVLTEIDHVGIAVRDLDAAGRFYERLGWRYVGNQRNQEGHLVSRYLLTLAR